MFCSGSCHSLCRRRLWTAGPFCVLSLSSWNIPTLEIRAGLSCSGPMVSRCRIGFLSGNKFSSALGILAPVLISLLPRKGSNLANQFNGLGHPCGTIAGLGCIRPLKTPARRAPNPNKYTRPQVATRGGGGIFSRKRASEPRRVYGRLVCLSQAARADSRVAHNRPTHTPPADRRQSVSAGADD